MQKISTCLSTFLLLSTWSYEASAQVSISEQGLQSCFEQNERLSRLSCYDALLKRPQTTNSAVSAVSEVPEETPKALILARELLAQGERFEESVSMSLWESKAERLSRDFETEDGGTLVSFLSKPKSAEEADALTAKYDVYLALKSEVEIGEPSILTVACKNDITRLSLTFEAPFEGKYANARFYGEDETVEQSGAKWRKMWVRGGGYTLENARGLDSIRLLQHISTGELGQVSINQGETFRSAFFKVPALKKALPFIANHCSWSNHSALADDSNNKQ